MDSTQMDVLQQFFKVMADEKRLRIVDLVGKRAYRVGELAEVLHLTEPTVSHHLSRLREVGLLNLKMDGNSKYFKLNRSMLRRYNKLVLELEEGPVERPPSKNDTAWIDELDIPAADRKVLRDYTFNGRLKQLPSKQKKLLVVLRWLVTMFEPDRKYTESEVNEIITQVHGDYAGLRRDLIEFGFMRRERGGGKYWLTPEDEEV
jgi:DNA-binding transcriptional ArsR family regulator